MQLQTSWPCCSFWQSFFWNGKTWCWAEVWLIDSGFFQVLLASWNCSLILIRHFRLDSRVMPSKRIYSLNPAKVTGILFEGIWFSPERAVKLKWIFFKLLRILIPSFTVLQLAVDCLKITFPEVFVVIHMRASWENFNSDRFWSIWERSRIKIHSCYIQIDGWLQKLGPKTIFMVRVYVSNCAGCLLLPGWFAK